MKNYNNLHYEIFFSSFFIIFSIHTSLVCSCIRVGILKGQNQSDFIFTGKVLKINKVITKEKTTGSNKIKDFIHYEFIFEIKHIHKGKKDFNFRDTITIISTAGGADCEKNFFLNKKYLVYAHEQDTKIGYGLWDQKADKNI